MPTFKSQIHDLVAQGQLEQALGLAKQQALAGLTELDTPATLLSAELVYLRQAAQRGTLTFEQETANRQNLTFRLLSIVDGLPENPLPSAAPSVASVAKDVILFLGANPFSNLALELEREMETISAGLSQFGKRDAYDFRARMHVTPADLQRMLLETSTLRPRFVHFAGNAVAEHPDYGTGVIFEDEKGQPRVVGGDVLARIFQQFAGVECVFLNTCDSGPSALAVGQSVPYAIGMNGRVYDDVAIEFAVAFYEAIANGQTVPFAFDFARLRIQMGNFPEQAALPVLIVDGKCDEPVYVPGASHLGTPNPRVMR